MKPVSLSLGSLALLFLLNGCQVPGKQVPNVGPFDSHGNYVEAWANDPSKWRAYNPKEVDADPPTIARNEQPPDHSVPLASGPAAPTIHAVASSRNKPPGARSGTRTKTKTNAERTVVRKATNPKSDTEPEIKSNSKSKDKPSVVKSKGKSSTTGSRHTVKSGDSLSSIAASHGTTVSALKKANGLASDKLRDGKTLVIPRGN
ncbi:MAG: LysM peptidoglycan-binding domain-containing protein [Verrucomicrobiota bacterium]